MFADIKVDDNIAYIQGMAMGKRIESAEVSWEEVAVGLGHLLITLNLLVLKYSYEYRCISNVKLLGPQTELQVRGRKHKYSLVNSHSSERQFGEMLEALLCETHYLCEHILEA